MYNRWLSSDELMHHQVKGAHWGVRNGPPYPLDRSKSDGHRLLTKSSGSTQGKKRYKTSEKTAHKRAERKNRTDVTDIESAKKKLRELGVDKASIDEFDLWAQEIPEKERAKWMRDEIGSIAKNKKNEDSTTSYKNIFSEKYKNESPVDVFRRMGEIGYVHDPRGLQKLNLSQKLKERQKTEFMQLLSSMPIDSKFKEDIKKFEKAAENYTKAHDASPYDYRAHEKASNQYSKAYEQLTRDMLRTIGVSDIDDADFNYINSHHYVNKVLDQYWKNEKRSSERYDLDGDEYHKLYDIFGKEVDATKIGKSIKDRVSSFKNKLFNGATESKTSEKDNTKPREELDIDYLNKKYSKNTNSSTWEPITSEKAKTKRGENYEINDWSGNGQDSIKKFKANSEAHINIARKAALQEARRIIGWHAEKNPEAKKFLNMSDNELSKRIGLDFVTAHSRNTVEFDFGDLGPGDFVGHEIAVEYDLDRRKVMNVSVMG